MFFDSIFSGMSSNFHEHVLGSHQEQRTKNKACESNQTGYLHTEADLRAKSIMNHNPQLLNILHDLVHNATTFPLDCEATDTNREMRETREFI